MSEIVLAPVVGVRAEGEILLSRRVTRLAEVIIRIIHRTSGWFLLQPPRGVSGQRRARSTLHGNDPGGFAWQILRRGSRIADVSMAGEVSTRTRMIDD